MANTVWQDIVCVIIGAMLSLFGVLVGRWLDDRRETSAIFSSVIVECEVCKKFVASGKFNEASISLRQVLEKLYNPAVYRKFSKTNVDLLESLVDDIGSLLTNGTVDGLPGALDNIIVNCKSFLL